MVSETLQLAVWSAGAFIALGIAGLAWTNRLRLVKLRQLIVGHETVDRDDGLAGEQETLFSKIECLEESMEEQHAQLMREFRELKRNQESNE